MPHPPRAGTGAAARRERWERLRRSLWQPPRPHGEQPRERVVGPLELARICAAVAVACVGLGAAQPSPLVLGLALVVLLSIPWGYAVTRRLASLADSPAR